VDWRLLRSDHAAPSVLRIKARPGHGVSIKKNIVCITGQNSHTRQKLAHELNKNNNKDDAQSASDDTNRENGD